MAVPLPDLLAISGRRYAESTAISKQLGNRRGSEATIEQLKLDGGDESRMWHAARAAQREYVFPQREDVIRQPSGLSGGIDATHKPGVLRRHSRRAMVGVTALCLDAPDRHHRFASDVDRVAAERGAADCQMCESAVRRSAVAQPAHPPPGAGNDMPRPAALPRSPPVYPRCQPAWRIPHESSSGREYAHASAFTLRTLQLSEH